jgi:hypothetical protein
MIEEPPPPSALDEELARVLQAAEPNPPEASEQDVVLALQLMEEEEKFQPSASASTSTTTTALTDAVLARRLSQGMSVGSSNTDEEFARSLSQGMALGSSHADEQLARRLSQGIPSVPNADELLARQLSQFEKPTSLEPAAEMVPEQLQILERIQQDKERKQIEQAMMESSLHELPLFQEMADTGIERSNAQDFQLSQELALNEWTSLQDRGPEARLSVGGGAGGSARSSALWNGLDRPANTHIHRVQISGTARSQQYDGAMVVNRAPGRAVSVDQGGRENPIEPRVAQPVRARSSASMSGPREERRLEPAVQRSQDLVRPRPPEDLLQRGNQETRSAIASGRAHVVLCQGCNSRLHAPMNYSLVFCPTCNTISPGLTVANGASGSMNSRGGSI